MTTMRSKASRAEAADQMSQRTSIGQRPPFELIALALQGGGALGSYHGGVYQALAEAGLHPDWVAGISIGALNSAIIAGNAPEKRVERLRAFWEDITRPPFGMPTLLGVEIEGHMLHAAVNQIRALGALFGGAPGFFTPRFPPPYLCQPGSLKALSFYEVGPVRETLARLVDFDLLNDGPTRLSVGAVNVRSGNFVYFDTANQRVGPDHIIASGSLPPGFPPAEIEGEYYWDGGLVSNTPLQYVLDARPRRDTLAFQVDLWNARGDLPKDLAEQETRQKEIRFSSRTRAGTAQIRKSQRLRRLVGALLKQVPPELRDTPEGRELIEEATEKVINIVQLIYRAQSYEGSSKDYEFSRRTMEEHWSAGYHDTLRTLRHREVLERPADADGLLTFDLAEHGRE